MSSNYSPGDIFINTIDENKVIQELSLDTESHKYSSTISNIFSKHCSEIKNTSEESLQSLYSISRKRLKELILKQNNELFLFMYKGDKNQSILGLAEGIFRKYNNDIPYIKEEYNRSITKDLNLDVSLDEAICELNKGLQKITSDPENSLHNFLLKNKWLFNQYKVIGDEVFRLESVLSQKIGALDKLNNRLSLINTLENTPVLPKLIESYIEYSKSVFIASKFEETYIELVKAYKKWYIIREIISLQNMVKDTSNEPKCSICLTDAVSQAIVPCGHTFCANCSKKIGITCHICRNTVRERIRLFFS